MHATRWSAGTIFLFFLFLMAGGPVAGGPEQHGVRVFLRVRHDDEDSARCVEVEQNQIRVLRNSREYLCDAVGAFE